MTTTLCLTIAVLLGILILDSPNADADINRGLKNYQAVISDQKKVEEFSPEELIEILEIHKIMKNRSGGSGSRYSQQG